MATISISGDVGFLRGDYEPFVDIEGNTRYRAVSYLDINIINDSLAEDAESFRLRFNDERDGFYLDDRECVSVWSTTVTIIDDDAPLQMEYSLVEAGPFEEDAGTVQVEVVAVTNEAGVPDTRVCRWGAVSECHRTVARRLQGSGRDTRFSCG